jgi:hypothetical protein
MAGALNGSSRKLALRAAVARGRQAQYLRGAHRHRAAPAVADDADLATPASVFSRSRRRRDVHGGLHAQLPTSSRPREPVLAVAQFHILSTGSKKAGASTA